MKKFTYKGFKVTVFENYDGNRMFISNAQGEQIWAHRFDGDAFAQAKRIIGKY